MGGSYEFGHDGIGLVQEEGHEISGLHVGCAVVLRFEGEALSVTAVGDDEGVGWAWCADFLLGGCDGGVDGLGEEGQAQAEGEEREHGFGLWA